MKVLVFGAGAMGSVFAGFLSKENDVTVIGREKHVEAIKEQGLQIMGIWGEHVFKEIKAVKSVDEIPTDATFDLIMITTKSNDTKKALTEIRPFVVKDTAVMSMQNGIGNEDIITQAIGVENTMGGMAIFGARLPEPGQAEVTVFASNCLVGDLPVSVTKRALEIAEVFSLADIPTKASDNIIRDKWMKAFYNIALNPLSAILRVPYGELGDKDATKEIIKSLLEEAFTVVEALGIPLKFTWSEYYDYLLETQLPPTAAHKSSMLQDIERGRKTEIDYLNGAVVKFGIGLGIETPVNKTITNIIKALEV
jgi:2-dehydropantoate 2-reductase